jgi:hypothetical protein
MTATNESSPLGRETNLLAAFKTCGLYQWTLNCYKERLCHILCQYL